MKRFYNILIRKLVTHVTSIYWRSKYGFLVEKYSLKSDLFFRGKNIEVYGDGSFAVGTHSYCGNNCAFQLEEGYKISIGSNCAISHNVRIYTSNRNVHYFFTQEGKEHDKADVTIGDHVWIGANVFIREGVTIGSDVVIGANSVVTRNVPSASVACGVPAKVIRNYNI